MHGYHFDDIRWNALSQVYLQLSLCLAFCGMFYAVVHSEYFTRQFSHRADAHLHSAFETSLALRHKYWTV